MSTKKQYAVYEKEPAHGKDRNGLILGPFNSEKEAEETGIKYGYFGDNYFVDELIENPIFAKADAYFDSNFNTTGSFRKLREFGNPQSQKLFKIYCDAYEQALKDNNIK